MTFQAQCIASSGLYNPKRPPLRTVSMTFAQAQDARILRNSDKICFQSSIYVKYYSIASFQQLNSGVLLAQDSHFKQLYVRLMEICSSTHPLFYDNIIFIIKSDMTKYMEIKMNTACVTTKEHFVHAPVSACHINVQYCNVAIAFARLHCSPSPLYPT